jgi:hypothetical protein
MVNNMNENKQLKINKLFINFRLTFDMCKDNDVKVIDSLLIFKHIN